MDCSNNSIWLYVCIYVYMYVCIYVVMQQPNAGSTGASSALMACGQGGNQRIPVCSQFCALSFWYNYMCDI